MHQIWNGECAHLAQDLPEGINCIITDPPYGINYESNFVTEANSAERFNRKIDNDEDPERAVANFIEAMTLIIPKLADDADVYIFTAWQVLAEWQAAVEILGLNLKQVLVWEKGWPGMGDLKTNWGCGYELILYAKKGNREVNHRRRGVISINRLPSKKNIHPTEKPVELLEALIEVSTNPGDLIVDPYAGSGSTIWAAQRTGRLGIGIEKDQNYAKDANERLGQVGFAFEY